MTEKPKVKGKVNPLPPSNPAKEYFTPTLNSIGVKIEALELQYMPENNGSRTADVRLRADGHKLFAKNCTAIVDCGISVTLPEGYCLKGEIKPYWANQGLHIINCFLDNDNHLRLLITNIGVRNDDPYTVQCGLETCRVNDGEIIAHIWAEPIYFLTWN